MTIKKTAAAATAFIVGFLLGYLIEFAALQWVASAVWSRVIVNAVRDPFVARIRFGLGFGALFATAVVLSRSPRRFLLYLSIGLLGSVAAAFYYRASYAAAALALPGGFPEALVRFDSLPVLKIPLVGLVAMACVATGLHFLRSRSREPLAADGSN